MNICPVCKGDRDDPDVHCECGPDMSMIWINRNTKLLFGDCLQVMSTLPEDSIDLVIADPPYNISQKNCDIDRSKLRHKRMSSFKRDFGDWDHYTDEDYEQFTNDWLTATLRLTKETCWYYVFFAKEKLGLLERFVKTNGLQFRTIISWCKTNPAPVLRKWNWISATELVYVFSKPKARLAEFLMPQPQMFNYQMTANKSIYGVTNHPNEKPTKLLEKFIITSTHEDDLVLDPFAGSGSTTIACLNTNRNSISIENNSNYFNEANKRINDHKSQLRLDYDRHDNTR